MTRPTRLLIAALVLLVGGMLLWTPIKKLLFGSPPATPSVLVSGNIEAHQSVLSFTAIQAPISWLPFDEGKSVQAGTVLAQVDDRLYRQQLQIDRTIMAVAQKQVAVNESNLTAVQNTVISDRLDLANKEQNFTRDQAQLKINAVSRQAFDLTSTVVAQAAATLARDQALVQEARDSIALARASLASDEAKLALD
jgi:HlyD family secretion protein